MEKCFVGEEAGPSNRRVEMFHFVKEDGNIEVLDSTEAFGMSVNIPNIDIAAHQCLPSSCNIREPLMSLLS
ncbi:hypothetical protein ACJMK2_002656 [Sinanodonta woodiana]|uniref:Uncharacterized protein n=1 Tax=Sinanodonta woodiana TaxID=1069815 RepID=A0ABD3XVC5_SINWO